MPATLGEMLKVSSFHDLSVWQEYEEARRDTPPSDPATPLTPPTEDGGGPAPAGAPGAGPSRRPPMLAQAPRTHSRSMRLVQALAPGFVNPSGSALSLAGVGAATAVGVGACHALRLLIRELLEALPRVLGIDPFLGPRPSPSALRRARTFELYLLSLLHHGAWVGLGLRRLLARAGWTERAGGATRALVLSAGYHLYILLSIDSIWTHPLVTLQAIGAAPPPNGIVTVNS